MNIYDKAAEDIKTNGKATGWIGMLPEGPHCLLGAIAHAKGCETRPTFGYSYDVVQREAIFVGEIIREQYPDHFLWRYPSVQGTFTFSDEKSAEDVVAILEKASVKYEEQI